MRLFRCRGCICIDRKQESAGDDTRSAVSALIGTWMIQWIRTSSRIKEDTAMGMILSVFSDWALSYHGEPNGGRESERTG